MKDALIIKPNRRRFDPESEFFLMGNIERFQAFRNRNSTINIWADDTNWIVDLAATADRIFKCLEAGCCQEFNSIRKFEEHKFKCHSHQCSVCNRSFTTDRLLSFHISELHDSYFAALSKKRPSYACLVESCTDLFWSDQDRREHLIKQHHFHVSYDFHDPKKFLRKFQQKLLHKTNQQAEHGDNHMHVDATPPHTATGTGKSLKTCDKHQDANAAGAVLPGGNRAQRRAMKRAEFETTHTESSITDPAHESSQNNSLHIMTDRAYGQGVHMSSGDTGIASSSVGSAGQVQTHVARAGSDSQRGAGAAIKNSRIPQVTAQCGDENNVSIDSMDVDDGLDGITQSLRTTNIHVPTKISFGRRKGHH